MVITIADMFFFSFSFFLVTIGAFLLRCFKISAWYCLCVITSNSHVIAVGCVDGDDKYHWDLSGDLLADPSWVLGVGFAGALLERGGRVGSSVF